MAVVMFFKSQSMTKWAILSAAVMSQSIKLSQSNSCLAPVVGVLGMSQEETSQILILFTFFMVYLTLMNKNNETLNKFSGYETYLILTGAASAGFFTSESVLTLFLWFEISVIPILILILGWGYQPERLTAGLYMFIYTALGSLSSIIWLVTAASNATSQTLILSLSSLAPFSEKWGVLLFLGFLVKLPAFGVHTWLPKAHGEAPVMGSMILASVLLKLGGFGLLRFSKMLGDGWEILGAVSMAGGAIVSLVCLANYDMKIVIAYSSVAHMALIVSLWQTGLPLSESSILLVMLAHGFVSSFLFSGMDFMYQKSGSRTFILNSGTLSTWPFFVTLWFFGNFMSMGGPPSTNFWAEVSGVMSLFSASKVHLFLAPATVFLSGAYSILLFISAYSKVFSEGTPSLNNWEMSIASSLHVILAAVSIVSVPLMF